MRIQWLIKTKRRTVVIKGADIYTAPFFLPRAKNTHNNEEESSNIFNGGL